MKKEEKYLCRCKTKNILSEVKLEEEPKFCVTCGSKIDTDGCKYMKEEVDSQKYLVSYTGVLSVVREYFDTKDGAIEFIQQKINEGTANITLSKIIDFDIIIKEK